MDGISIDEKFYLFALRMDNGDNGNLAFSIDGVALIMFDINADDQIINVEQLETPLFTRIQVDGVWYMDKRLCLC